MRIGLTGGTGFIGGAFVRRLLAKGISVRALARPSSRAEELAAKGVEVVPGDLSNRAAVLAVLDGVQVVYHLAAKVHGPGSRKQFLETNVQGTEQLLEACIAKGVPHVVYLSSIAVYGLAQAGIAITEDTALDPLPAERSKYAQSKIEADTRAAAIAQKANLMVTILRPGVVYGAGAPVPVALLGFRVGNLNVVFGRREQGFPLTYVENLVDAIWLVGQRNSGGLKRYIVLDNDDLTLAAYHQALRRVAKTRTLFFPGWPVSLAALTGAALGWFPPWAQGVRGWRREVKRALEDRRYSTGRIREETGWAPRVGLEAAITQTWKGSR